MIEFAFSLALWLAPQEAATETVAAPAAPAEAVTAPTALADDGTPTLAQIFRHPRLLGTRPGAPSIAADGSHCLFEWAQTDAEKPHAHHYVVATADGEPRRLFRDEDEDDIQTWWTHVGARLLVYRRGWLELYDLASGDAPRPLLEVGPRLRGLTLLEQSDAVAFQTGEDHRLWLLDLASGARSAPIDHLKRRGDWFQVLEDIQRVAVFADPAERGATKPADAKPPKDAAAATGGAKTPAEEPKRVLFVCPLTQGDFDWETTFTEGGVVSMSGDGRFALRRTSANHAERQLILADYLTERVSTVPVRSDLPGDAAAAIDLELYDVEDQRALEVALDAGEHFWSTRTRWSPTGHELLVERVSNDFHVRQILTVDPEAGRTRLLHSERDDAWIGGPLLWCDWRDDGAVWFTSEQGGFNHLYRADAEASVPTPITDATAAFEVLEVVAPRELEQLVALTNEPDPAERRVYVIDPATGERRPISDAGRVAGDVALSRDGSRVVWRQEALGLPVELFTAPIDGSAPPRQLTRTTPAAYLDLQLPAPEIVDYQSADGTRVRAFLYRPVPFDPTATYPAVMFIHGAGYLQNVTRSMSEYAVNMLFHHRLTRRGFVVIDPDYRHSAGYGRDFRAGVHGFMGGKDLDDVVAGVDYLKSLGFVDTTRVGIYGGSYGGFLTLMALFTRPTVFAAGCALRSVTDWRTYNAWYTNPRLGDPQKDADNYRKSSPIDHAEGLQRPLLLLHGMKDANVFAQDTIRLMEKLIELGKDFDVMLYPSQDHAFSDPDSWIDEYRRIERFFQRHLQRADH